MANDDHERTHRSRLSLSLWLVAAALIGILLIRASRGADESAAATGPATALADTGGSPDAADTTSRDTTPADTAGARADTGLVMRVLADTTLERVSGDAVVATMPPERSFWIKENGERLLVILAQPVENLDVDRDQRVRIDSALVLTGTDTAEIPDDVDAQTRGIAAQQRRFLLVRTSRVTIIPGDTADTARN